MRRLATATALLALAAPLVAAGPSSAPLAAAEGIGTGGMTHVANVQWDDTRRADAGRTIDTQGGTDVEFATIDGRDYAFAGTYDNGVQVVDITDPTTPVLVTTYECDILQGDTQTFQRDGRWYLTFTADSGYSHKETQCHRDADAGPGNGTFIIDITDPSAPKAITFVTIPGGSHNQTVHPSGMWMYNSNSGGGGGVIEVISLADLKAPEIVTRLATSSSEDAHDITFNADGTRAYAANIDHTLVIDTTDPAAPSIISTITDPAATLHHQSDPVTIGDRTFVIINDELAGAAGNEVCPGGGLHVWDVTDEANPTKVGAYFIPDVTVREGARTGAGGTVTCTSHVFRIYEDQQIMTIAWFGAGVHVLDLSGLGGPATGIGGSVQLGRPGFDTAGIREVASYRFAEDSDAWSAKAYRFDEDGSAYVYADDQTRGFDVYHFDATAEPSAEPGLWATPTQAMQRKLDLLASGFVPSLRPICELRGVTA